MAQDNPLLLAGMIAAAGITLKWWCDDYRRAALGTANPRAFPGTTPANRRAVTVAIAGILFLLAVETGGEYALGLTARQSHMTALFAVYSLAAAFVEELIFRGFLVVENRGLRARLAGIVAASLGFALLHPFLWEWNEGTLKFHGDAKAWFSTAMILAGALWFYAVRFFPLNPSHSLVPCILAHGTKNLGVFAIKYAQGFVSDWW